MRTTKVPSSGTATWNESAQQRPPERVRTAPWDERKSVVLSVKLSLFRWSGCLIGHAEESCRLENSTPTSSSCVRSALSARDLTVAEYCDNITFIQQPRAECIAPGFDSWIEHVDSWMDVGS